MRALIVAVFVGTALNLINQGDALFSGGRLILWKAALTYVVPFLVSAHGALTARR
ncbi:MAG: nitrate/nitrite transporter NrtS [Alphaproteobacteria bacterium]|nr:nitrate/nitrite transporter NrtS [Alphaproteobacteria bacterium]